MRALSLLCLAFVAACFPPEKMQVSSVDAAYVEDPVDSYCDERSYDVGLTETTALGFSASDVLSLVAGPREATLTYADGSTTTLTLSAETDGGYVGYIESTPVGDAEGCEDHLDLAVNVHLSTADGLFDETMLSVLTPSTLDGGVTLYFGQLIEALVGAFSLEGTDLLHCKALISADAFTGEIIAEHEARSEEEPNLYCGVGAWGMDLSTGCW